MLLYCAKTFILIDFMRFLRIIVTKGNGSKLSKQNISTTVSGDLIVTHLIGKINTVDVYEWFNGFRASLSAIHFRWSEIQYYWWIERIHTRYIFLFKKHGKISLFNETILNHSKAIAFLLEEGEIMNYLQQSNTKESVKFFDDYEQAFIWLNEYPI